MQRFINNWTSRLESPLAPSALTLQVPVEDAARLVGLGVGDHYVLTLASVDDSGKESAWEIVRATAAAGGEIVVERGLEDTHPASWPAGTVISARLTAGSISVLENSGVVVGDVLFTGRNPGADYIDVTDQGHTIIKAEYPDLAAIWPVRAESDGFPMYIAGLSTSGGAVDAACHMFASGADIYVLGSGTAEKLRRYTQGQDLQVAPTTAEAIDGVPGYAVVGAAAGDLIMLAAAGGNVYVSQDRGETWSTVSAGYTDTPKKVAVNGDCAAIITDSAETYVSADAGANWASTSEPTYYDETLDGDIPAAVLFDLAFGDDADGTYVTVSYLGSGEGRLARLWVDYIDDGWETSALEAATDTPILLSSSAASDSLLVLYRYSGDSSIRVSLFDWSSESETQYPAIVPAGLPIGIAEQPASGAPVVLCLSANAANMHYSYRDASGTLVWEEIYVGGYIPGGATVSLMTWQLPGGYYGSRAIGGLAAAAVCHADRHGIGTYIGERLEYNPETEVYIPQVIAPAPIRAYVKMR